MATLYSENFEGFSIGTDMFANGWTRTAFGGDGGTFSVITGKYGSLTGSNWAGHITLDEGTSWDNYELTLDVPSTDARIMVGVRMNGTTNGYLIVIIPGFASEDHFFKMTGVYPGGTTELHNGSMMSAVTSIRIVCSGSNIKVYYNGSGTPNHDVTDATYSTGTIGFSAYLGGWRVDNILVSTGTDPIPNWVSTYPKAGIITSRTIPALLKVDQAGTGYTVCLSNGADAPTSAQVKAGTDADDNLLAVNLRGSVSLTANVEATVTSTELSNTTDYDIYAVAESSGGLMTSPSKIDAITLAPVLPTWSSGYPKIGNLGISSIQVLVKTDTAGFAYCVCVANGDPVPSIDNLKASRGGITLVANTENSFTFNNLISRITYDFYIVAENSDEIFTKGFVAVASSSTAGGFSEDGETWIATTEPNAGGLDTVAHDGVKYMACQWQGSNAGNTTDGKNWTLRAMPSSSGWSATATDGESGVNVSLNDKKNAVTTDHGDTWVGYTNMPVEASYQAIAYNGKYFCTISYNGTYSAISSDGGVTWTQGTLPTGRLWMAIAWNRSVGKWCIVENGTSGGTKYSAVSSDGLNWTEANNMPQAGIWGCISSDGEKYVAFLSNTDKAAYSTDGLNWTQFDMPDTSGWVGSTFGGGRWCVVPYGGVVAAYSDDGSTFVEATYPYATATFGVTYGSENNGLQTTIATLSSTVMDGPGIDAPSYRQASKTYLSKRSSGEIYLTPSDWR